MMKSCSIVLELLKKVFDNDYLCQIGYDVNWVDVIEVASEQGVLGVCFDAIEHLPRDQRPDMDCLMDWLGQAEYQKTVYSQHEVAILDLAKTYSNHHIRMMVLKGYGLSWNYPVPALRPCGDIDIYLFGKQEVAFCVDV